MVFGLAAAIDVGHWGRTTLVVNADSENAREVSSRRTAVGIRLSLLVVVTVLATLMAGAPALAGTPQDTVGVVDQTTGVWYLRDASNGATTSFYYGNPGDYPMVGDWNCDGIDTPGLYRQFDGYVYLRNSNTQGNADIRFFFGNPGDIPLAGDFNKDGCDTVSIYRPSEARIFVINELGSNDGGLGAADYSFLFGNPGDKPFTGDFNNNGQDTVGLHRESTGFVYFRDTLTTGIADSDFFYGNPGDQIITGSWAEDPTKGPDTVGLFRPSNGRFYLRFENSQGNANVDFAYGNADMTGVAGDFGVLPGGSVAPPSNSTWTLPAYDGSVRPDGATAEALGPERLEYVDVSQPDDPEYDIRLSVDGIPLYMEVDWILLPSNGGAVVLSYFLNPDHLAVGPQFMWAVERGSADGKIYLSESLHFSVPDDEELLSVCWSDFYGGPVVAIVAGASAPVSIDRAWVFKWQPSSSWPGLEGTWLGLDETLIDPQTVLVPPFPGNALPTCGN